MRPAAGLEVPFSPREQGQLRVDTSQAFFRPMVFGVRIASVIAAGATAVAAELRERAESGKAFLGVVQGVVSPVERLLGGCQGEFGLTECRADVAAGVA